MSSKTGTPVTFGAAHSGVEDDLINMASFRVLFWMPRASVIPGGHLVQLRETARGLAELGCIVTERVEFDLPDPDVTAEIDIVHGFDLSAEQVRACHRRGLPVAISPIYWRRAYRYGGPTQRPTARDFLGRLNRGRRFALASLHGHAALIGTSMNELRGELELITALSSADLLLPNALGEAQDLRRDLGVSTPSVIIPNGADAERFHPPDAAHAQARDGVLFVGRAEPHKNQLGLLSALRDSDVNLTLACVEHRDHRAYLESCRTLASGWANVVEDPGPDLLADLYRKARVHVLPSWFETTGLVSLEAGLSGCNVVSTNRGHAAEYLGDMAWYCDPARPDSIRVAVEAAHVSPPVSALRDHILNSYTWRHVAKATMRAYKEIAN